MLNTHAQNKIFKIDSKCGLLLSKGIKKWNPESIAIIFKTQVLTLFYGIELANFTATNLKNYQTRIQKSFKHLLNCSSHCSNKILKVFQIPQFEEIIKGKRRTILKLILSHQKTF